MSDPSLRPSRDRWRRCADRIRRDAVRKKNAQELHKTWTMLLYASLWRISAKCANSTESSQAEATWCRVCPTEDAASEILGMQTALSVWLPRFRVQHGESAMQPASRSLCPTAAQGNFKQEAATTNRLIPQRC